MSQKKEPPSWLHQNFIENALRIAFKNEDLKILNMELNLATAAAENYASQMFRITLLLKTNKQGTKEKLSIIAKMIVSGETGKELANSQIYDKEAVAFESVLPVIDTLLKSAYPNHKKLWAKCYYYQKDPNYIILLEDLRVSGYTLASRFEGLDMEHATLALRSLAKLHAASLIWKSRHPEKANFYYSTPWNDRKSGFLKKTLTQPFRIIAEDVLTWPGYDKREIVSQKLIKLEETALDSIYDTWERNPSKLNVLLHGDAWVNNFMFKYDPNGKLAGINFVDFQIMSINSPAMDLQYFVFTSAAPNLKFDCIDKFLEIYYEAFDDTLKRLGHQLEKPYSLEQLKADFNEKYFWGFTVLCVIYPVLLIPPSEAFHPDEFLQETTDGNYTKAYKRESMREVLKRGFQFFEEKGVF